MVRSIHYSSSLIEPRTVRSHSETPCGCSTKLFSSESAVATQSSKGLFKCSCHWQLMIDAGVLTSTIYRLMYGFCELSSCFIESDKSSRMLLFL